VIDPAADALGGTALGVPEYEPVGSAGQAAIMALIRSMVRLPTALVILTTQPKARRSLPRSKPR
jgi:hypothetical protein